MGLFTSFNGKNKSQNQNDSLPWIDLKDISQLDSVESNSFDKPQFIFKHSTRCGVSRIVLQMFKKEYGLSEEEADLYFLDIIQNRDISNKIAEKFDVRHESPQLLIISDGKVIAHKSHGEINDIKAVDYVN